MTQFQSDAAILKIKGLLERVDRYIDDTSDIGYQDRNNHMFGLLHERIETINRDLNSREMSDHERENYNTLKDEINVRIERLRPLITTGGRKKRKSRRRKSRRRQSRRRQSRRRQSKRRQSRRR